MPDQPRTPLRSIRVPDELWRAAQEKAAREGTTVSDAVRGFLARWVKRPGRGPAHRVNEADR